MPRIPPEVIRALSHSATVTNDKLLQLPTYSEARMSTIARQAVQEGVQEMQHFIQQVYVYQ